MTSRPPSSSERRDLMDQFDPMPGIIKITLVALAIAGAARFSYDQIKALLHTPTVSQPAEK